MLKIIKNGIHIALNISKYNLKIVFIIFVDKFKKKGLTIRLYKSILIKIPSIKNILISPLF